MSTGTPEQPLHLVADVGGTHARFALCRSVADIDHISKVKTADFPTLQQAIQRYLDQLGNPPVDSAAVGIANPVVGDHVKMTNSPWGFSIEDARQTLGLRALHVINDFTALALALPHLDDQSLRRVGGTMAGVRGTPLGVIGPGTGMGVSGLIPMPGGGWIPLASEGGHASFAPADDMEAMLWQAAHKEYGHVSTERLVSGPGLVFMYRHICERKEQTPRDYSPADISRLAMAGEDPGCAAALETFCAILGTAASNLALTLGARGGIYIGGGIVPKLGDYFLQSPFRSRFEDKGRFAEYLAAIPVYVIVDDYPALVGAAAYLDTCKHG